MADLSLNPADVRDLGTHLASISREFREANTRSDRIAAAVGHSGLEDAVKDFAHEWDDTREAMVDDINTLSKTSIAIADAFEQTDQQLGNALTDTPSAPASRAAAR
ncbi:hypothetical protein [Lacisediminihabitans sp. H27-G8]|uniref:hypothetical protein n=1 Tax=Lacisediminihabitans sp. H27-G8 TaxID=3111909 RepID=UPI0038FC9226